MKEKKRLAGLKKAVDLKLKFKCDGWVHTVACTVSCIEEFQGERWMWTKEPHPTTTRCTKHSNCKKGQLVVERDDGHPQTGGLKNSEWKAIAYAKPYLMNKKKADKNGTPEKRWKYIKEQGYVERCKLKELLGEKCVHHAKACFDKKSPKTCGKGSATSRRVQQNARLGDILAKAGQITKENYCLMTLNLPPSIAIKCAKGGDCRVAKTGKICPKMPPLTKQDIVSRFLNWYFDIHMRNVGEKANGSFKRHKCPYHKKVKVEEADLEDLLDVADSAGSTGRPVDVQLSDRFGGGSEC